MRLPEQGRDAVVVVASRSYIKAHGVPRSVSDLKNHSVLRLSWEAEQPGWRFRGQQPKLSFHFHGNFLSSDAGLIRDASASGLGVALLPSFVVAQDVRAGRLVRMLEHERLLDVPIHVLYAARRSLPLRTRAFVDFVVQRFANPTWRQRALLVPKA